MAETIYTIPINEVFEENMTPGHDACPFCALRAKLESDELDIILGASMMEPDIRIRTNELGFCSAHFSRMLRHSKRLPLALILESHLAEVSDRLGRKGPLRPSPDKLEKTLSDLSSSCYICGRIGENERRLLSNAAYMWKTDADFPKKLDAQPYICIGHAAKFLAAARQELGRKQLSDFADSLSALLNRRLDGLRADVSGFAKSFDYRYAGESLTTGEKTSVERSVRYLAGDRTAEIK